MRISTKGLYAVRMMLYLARQDVTRPISLKEISEAQHISKKYLEQIVAGLTSANLVSAQRGASGGYRLTKDPSTCTLLDILRVTEVSLAPTGCLENGAAQCSFSEPCMELNVWQGLQSTIEDYLGGTSLQDILDDNSTRSADNYSI